MEYADRIFLLGKGVTNEKKASKCNIQAPCGSRRVAITEATSQGQRVCIHPARKRSKQEGPFSGGSLATMQKAFPHQRQCTEDLWRRWFLTFQQ